MVVTSFVQHIRKGGFLLAAACVLAGLVQFVEVHQACFTPSWARLSTFASWRATQCTSSDRLPLRLLGTPVARIPAGCRLPGFQAGRQSSLKLRLAAQGEQDEQEEESQKRIKELLAQRMDSNDKRNFNLQSMSKQERRKYEKMGEELMDAVRDSDAELVTELCTQGKKGVLADPEYVDEFGFGPLHLAAKRGDLSVINALVAAGADVNLGGEGGTVPLHFAAQAGQLAAVQRLVGLGGDVDHRDNTQSTPLRMAQSFNRKEVEAYLRPLQGTGSGQWTKLDDASDIFAEFEEGFAKALEDGVEERERESDLQTIETETVAAEEAQADSLWEEADTDAINEVLETKQNLQDDNEAETTRAVPSLAEVLADLDDTPLDDSKPDSVDDKPETPIDAEVRRAELATPPEAKAEERAGAEKEEEDLSDLSLEELQAEVQRRQSASGDGAPSQALMREIDDMLLGGEGEEGKDKSETGEK